MEISQITLAEIRERIKDKEINGNFIFRLRNRGTTIREIARCVRVPEATIRHILELGRERGMVD